MTDRAPPRTREELRAELPELAEFVDLLRDAFGDGVRVLGISTEHWQVGNCRLEPGIRLSECAWVSSDELQPAASSRRAASRRI